MAANEKEAGHEKNLLVYMGKPAFAAAAGNGGYLCSVYFSGFLYCKFQVRRRVKMNKLVGTCTKCDEPGIFLWLGPRNFDEDPIFLCQKHKDEADNQNRASELVVVVNFR